MKKLQALIIIGCIIIASLSIFCKKEEEEGLPDPTPTNPLVIDTANNQILMSAVLERTWCDDSVARHNCAVYKNGSNAYKALFLTNAHHADFYHALISLGADPGVDIGPTPDSNAVPTGSLLKLYVRWEGSPKTYDINELVVDSLGRGLQARMHNSYVRAVETNKGCIYCYTACRTSITSNPTYTWGENLKKLGKFQPKKDLLPPDGTHIVLIFELQ